MTNRWTELHSRRLEQNPETPARSIDGEAIVITPRDSTLHSLNETATFVWDRCDGTQTLDAIVADLLAAFDVDGDVARVEVVSFVDRAVALGLLRFAI
jgi:Coenzyme PQQ synthesis protein D (PqqD)